MNSTPRSPLIGKVLYGLLFVIVVPSLLVIWADMTEPFVPLPVPGTPVAGTVVALGGLSLIALGMAHLAIYGRGLPMNPYPPRNYVTVGIYRFMPHPIYTGFSLLSVGMSVALRSSSGLWLVSPIVILGCTALVLGYERIDLVRRFGNLSSRPLICLAANDDRVPTLSERVSIYVMVFLPWLTLYEAVRVLGVPPDAVEAYLPFERHLPVYEWTELFYGSTYLFVLLVPLVARSRRSLRQFSVAGLAATVVVTLIFIAVPLVAPPRPFAARTLLGAILQWERALDTPAAAFPSFHVIWAFLAARAYAQAMPARRFLWWLIAALISLSCITTGQHAMVDVFAGLLVAFALFRLERLWAGLRRITERVANSWKEWRIGPVRIINHGMYSGIGAFLGLALVGTALGEDYILPMTVAALAGLVMAALWAQYIEGSPSLLRPYGFYGGLLGVVLGSLAAPLFAVNTWLLLGAYSIAAPWIQAAGRLRCLVQGCCHGAPSSEVVGIRYIHPMSRVCRLANLCDVPIHPTPLYSILWNVVTGVMLVRFWLVDAHLPLITGLYFILNGLGRFVEEAYRGEPQTRVLAGLRLYQWIAIASIFSGAVLTTMNSSAAVPSPEFNWAAIVSAFLFGLFVWVAQGVDFPESNKRFSRLA